MKQWGKKVWSILLSGALLIGCMAPASAYPAGSIQADITEAQISSEILDSLAKHISYTEKIFHDYDSVIPGAGYFHSGAAGEDGIRTHNNYVLVYAFLYKELPDEKLSLLPSGMTRQKLKERVIEGMTYAVNTHKVSQYNCVSGGKWGLVWESALWSSKLGFAGYLMDGELSADLQAKLQAVIVAEADLIASRTPPTQKVGDTKAEENGWDTNVVALATNMYPDHTNAEKWDYTAKRFAMNTMSVEKDKTDTTMVDGKMVKEWVLGANLYDDYSLENHNIYHPVYQMSPYLELADSMLYYTMAGNDIPKSFEHNMEITFDRVMKKTALATGEWAYPNGCDWSVELLDHVGAYALMAVYYQDPEAKLLEQRTWQFIRERQKLYSDGSFIGPNSDIGPRRESVQSERLIATYFIHKYMGDWPSESVTWEQFMENNAGTGTITNDKIVYSKNASRFASFSWTNKFMALVAPDSNAYLDQGFVIFPYQKNFTGQFTTDGHGVTQTYTAHNNTMYSDGFATCGELLENGILKHYVAFAALPGNGTIYLDNVLAADSGRITKEEGIPIGIQTDKISGETRTFTYEGGQLKSNGKNNPSIPGNWVNMDNQLGMIVEGSSGIRFGDWTDNKGIARSVAFSRLYGSYSTQAKSFAKGDTVADRAAVIYSNVSPEETKALSQNVKFFEAPAGSKAVAVTDTDGMEYVMVANFYAGTSGQIETSLDSGAPVLDWDGAITGSVNRSSSLIKPLTAKVSPVEAYITAANGTVHAVRSRGGNGSFHVKNDGTEDVNIQIRMKGQSGWIAADKTVAAGKSYLVSVSGDNISMEEADYKWEGSLIKAFEAVGIKNGSAAQLTWDTAAAFTDDIVIERKTVDSDFKPLVTLPASARSYTDGTLQPGQVYTYRIGVSIEEKALYQVSGYVSGSELEQEGSKVNIALGKPAYAESTGVDCTDPKFPTSRLTDGKYEGTTTGNMWTSVVVYPSKNPITLTLDLLKEDTFSEIEIVSRLNEQSSATSYGPRNFDILVSSDDKDYTKIKSITDFKKAGDVIKLDNAVKARYVRFVFTQSYDAANQPTPRNVQIREIMIYRYQPALTVVNREAAEVVVGVDTSAADAGNLAVVGIYDGAALLACKIIQSGAPYANVTIPCNLEAGKEYQAKLFVWESSGHLSPRFLPVERTF